MQTWLFAVFADGFGLELLLDAFVVGHLSFIGEITLAQQVPFDTVIHMKYGSWSVLLSNGKSDP